MAEPIEKSRNSCALHGALQTIQEIEGTVGIIHSNAGCGIQQYLGGTRSSGGSGSGYSGGFSTPSSNIIEKQVIFGGTSRLREEIKNTVKVIKADLYVTLSGCVSELVGDDVLSMAKEAREQGDPVIYLKTPGFKGKIQSGYEETVKGIIEQIPLITKVEALKTKGLINVFGIIPKQDIHWKGNLEELKRILEGIGLKVNTLFGFGQGLEQWKQLPAAELNLVFSPWGISVAEKLQIKYSIPFIHFNSIPVGSEDTSKFLIDIGNKLSLDLKDVKEYIKREEKQINYYLENLLDFYYDYNFQKNFSLVGETTTVIGISKFLVKEFGMIPELIIVTDPVEDSLKEGIIGQIFGIENSLSFEVYFTEDSGEIDKLLEASGTELILGSSLEKSIADKLKLPLVVISFPDLDNVILNKGYLGYKGAISLIEDVSRLILKNEKKINKEIENEIRKGLFI